MYRNEQELDVHRTREALEMNAEELYEKAVKAWGKEAQLGVAMEECAELISAIIRYKRGRTGCAPVAEEIADVLIMAEQSRLIIGPNLVDEFKKQKLERLGQRLETE